MNYKVKWLMNWLVFPMLVLFPIFIHIAIQSVGVEQNLAYPPSSGYLIYVVLIYLPVFFMILSYIYLDLNGWKKFRKPQGFLIIILYSFILTMLSMLEHVFFSLKYGPDNDPNTVLFVFQTIFVMIIGSALFQFFYGSFNSIYSFKGPKNYTIHQFAFKMTSTFFWKRWNLVVDYDIMIDKNHYENYSILYSKRAIYILSYYIFELDEEIAFETKNEVEGLTNGVTKSLFTESNFSFATKKEIINEEPKVLDIFEELDNDVQDFVLIFPEINLEKNQEVLYKKQFISSNSSYIENIIYKRNILKKTILERLRFDNNVSEEKLSNIEIINLIVIDSLSKDTESKGTNEDFLILNEVEMISKIKELESYLSDENKKIINKIRKIL